MGAKVELTKVTAAGTPFAGEDVSKRGYVEEEYFVSGRADARTAKGEVVEADASYTTRILVRRPADGSGFSGNVHLEPLHVLGESAATWGVAQTYLTRHGDAWIGVTVNSGSFGQAAESPHAPPGGITVLKQTDPDGYAPLHLWEAPEDEVAALADAPMVDSDRMMDRIMLAIAQGHSIMGQVAELVASGDASSPLADLPVERLYGSGWSQTGMFWRYFLEHGDHERLRRADGSPVIDGYLIAVAPAPDVTPADAYVVNMISEGEVVGCLGRPVSLPPDAERFRAYEVAGTGHTWRMRDLGPSDGHAIHNDRPYELLVHAVFEGLDRWVRDGIAMPIEPRITRDKKAKDTVARDEHGNALGGVRLPWIDVPVATYGSMCTCHPLISWMKPFDDDAIAGLYGSRDKYETRFRDAVGAMVAGGWLLPDDVATVTP